MSNDDSDTLPVPGGEIRLDAHGNPEDIVVGAPADVHVERVDGAHVRIRIDGAARGGRRDTLRVDVSAATPVAVTVETQPRTGAGVALGAGPRGWTAVAIALPGSGSQVAFVVAGPEPLLRLGAYDVSAGFWDSATGAAWRREHVSHWCDPTALLPPAEGHGRPYARAPRSRT